MLKDKMKRKMDKDELDVLNSFNNGKSVINEYTTEKYIKNELFYILEKTYENYFRLFNTIYENDKYQHIIKDKIKDINKQVQDQINNMKSNKKINQKSKKYIKKLAKEILLQLHYLEYDVSILLESLYEIIYLYNLHNDKYAGFTKENCNDLDIIINNRINQFDIKINYQKYKSKNIGINNFNKKKYSIKVLVDFIKSILNNYKIECKYSSDSFLKVYINNVKNNKFGDNSQKNILKDINFFKK